MSGVVKFEELVGGISGYHHSHILADGYYEGTINVPSLGISVPPILEHIQTVVGWPGTAVDVLEERLNWQGWSGDPALDQVYEENLLGYESSLAHLDSLMYGVSFMAVSAGADDEPSVLVTAESPKDMTGIWNRRKRRLDCAAAVQRDEGGNPTSGTLYLPDRTMRFRKGTGGRWLADGVDEHGLGRVPVVRLINRGRAGRRGGRSEITRAIRAYTDTAVRTLLGMEVNREFYSAPQRYVLGAKEDAFMDENGNPIPGWQAIMGSVWGLERDDEALTGDGLPEVGQFNPVSPGPYLEQIRGLGQLFSAEAGIPATYLGFSTEQAASADAIRAMEARLVKRAERRQDMWSAAYMEMGRLALMFRGEDIDYENLALIWGDAATPTRSADTDRAMKLISVNMLPAQSSVAMEMAGLSPSQQKRLKSDRFSEALARLISGEEDDNEGAAEPARYDYAEDE